MRVYRSASWSWFAYLALAVGLVPLHAHPAAAQCSDLFQPVALFGAGPYSLAVAVGDIDRDGVPDIVVANYHDASLSYLRGLGSGGVGTGTFAPEIRIAVGAGPRNIAIADFNADGNLDLAVTLLDAGQTAILMGRGTGAPSPFEAPVYLPTGAGSRSVLVGDFNEDGIRDLAVTVTDLDQVVVLLGHGAGGVGDGTFASPVPYATADGPWGIATGDFNADGIADLAVAATGAGAVSVLLGRGASGTGDGTFGPRNSFPVGYRPINVACADFDGDGISDLACTLGSSEVGLLRGQAVGGVPTGGFMSVGTTAVGVSPEGIVAADFNRDGIADVATANIVDASVSVLLGLGPPAGGGFPLVRIADRPAAAWAAGIAAADLNDDGATDLVTSGALDDNVAVLLGACLTPPPPPQPVLTSVRDVPDDQGGQVFVTWAASGLDVAPLREITGYRVWRRIPAELQAEAAGRPGPEVMARPVRGPASTEVTYWEAIASVPAERLEGYGVVAPTLTDSTRDHNPYTAFFVSALTADPFVFYPSNVDSGYSVDNIRPRRPEQAEGVYGAGSVTLHWIPDPAPDVVMQRIYRGADAEFPLDDAHLLAATPDTGYVDEGGGATDFYAIASEDVHGNVGEAARIVPPGVTAASPGSPPALRILGLVPNPASGPPAVSFALPSSAPATLELIDVSGRRRCGQDVAAPGPGLHLATLRSGAALEPGLYVVRLSQSGTRVTAKLVVTR